MPHELIIRFLSEHAYFMTGRHKQHCFDSPLWSSLHIAISWEPSVVSEE
jgi:hypothetical protein